MRRATGNGMKEIAEKIGVNISTVSRVINRRGSISQATQEAVMRAAHAMGYIGKDASRMVGVVLPETGLGYYGMNMFNAIHRELTRRHWNGEFIFPHQLDSVNERAISGLISFDFGLKLATLAAGSSNLPLVCINDQARHIDNIYSVYSNAYSAIQLAMNHLVQMGHYRIAMIINGVPDFLSNRNRIEAFEQIKHRFVLDDAVCVTNLRDQDAHTECCDMIRELVDNGITAIINTGEGSVFALLHSLDLCNITIPRDMSLISWELPNTSKFLHGGLTTVGQNFDAIAQNAFDVLDKQFSGMVPTSDIAIDYTLFKRNSVAAPPETSGKPSTAGKKKNH